MSEELVHLLHGDVTRQSLWQGFRLQAGDLAWIRRIHQSRNKTVDGVDGETHIQMFDDRDRSGKRLDLRATVHSGSNGNQCLMQKCSTRSSILEKSRVDQRGKSLVIGVIQDLQFELHVNGVIQQIQRFSWDTLDNGVPALFRTKERVLQGLLHPPGIKGLAKRRNLFLIQGTTRQIIIKTLY